MVVSTRPDNFELSDYLDVVRRRWAIVVALALVGLLVAGLYVEHDPKTYTGSVLVQVDPLPNSANAVAGRTNGNVNMDNEAQVARSVPVATLAARQLRSPLPVQDLIAKTAVSVPANTTFLRISCNAPSAAGAAQCANDFGNAFLSYTRTSAANSVAHDLSDYRAQLAGLQTKVRGLKAQLARRPGQGPQQVAIEIKLGETDSSITATEAHINQTIPLLDNLNQPNNAAVGDIAAPAVPPSAPTSPRRLVLPSGLFAGLLAGLVLAFLVDRRDVRLHASSNPERLLNLPVLFDAADEQLGLLTAVAPPRSAAGRAFTELAQYVVGSLGDDNHVLVVAGTSAGAGSGVIAANLASTLARDHAEVVLVCAGLRATTPLLVGVSEGRGLSDLLAGNATTSEITRRPLGLPRLRVIPPGTGFSGTPSQPRHEAFGLMVSELLRDARYVIIEAQSVGEDAENFTLSEFADRALVVAEITETRRPDALECVQRLNRIGVPVLGAALLPARRVRFGTRRRRSRQPDGVASAWRLRRRAAPYGPTGQAE